MRCRGDAGRCHYFHEDCLRTWIQTCNGRPTCPVCRGHVQVNAQRLREFLARSDVEAEERSFLTRLLDAMPATEGWSDAFTTENAVYAASVGAGAAYGFWQGYADNAQPRSWHDHVLRQELRQQLPPHVRTAELVGYLAGLGARVAKSVRDQRSQGRCDEQDHAQSPARRQRPTAKAPQPRLV